MNGPTIFIASSGKAKGRAKDLRNRLNQSESFRHVNLWSDVFPEQGSVTIEALGQFAKGSDFFAGLFTGDDVLVREGDENRVPRDNCVFEAGPFFAALGFDLNRCFLLSDVDERALPSDLRGITLVDLKDGIDSAAETILQRVKKTNPLRYERPEIPVLARGQLFERERPETKGGDLRSDGGLSVVVNSSEPAETDPLGAASVLANVESGVTYEYFFEGAERNIPFVKNLFRALAVANVRSQSGSLTDSEWFELMQKNQDQITKNLERMKKGVSIHFRPRPPLQFCVHNANSVTYARCYLNYPGKGFVEWHRGNDAVTVAEDLTNSCAVPASTRRASVFHSTTDFDIDEEKEFKEELLDQIERAFPTGETGPGKIDLRELARQVSFGFSEVRKQPAAAQAP